MNIITKLRKLGIVLFLKEGKLKIEAPEGTMTPTLLTQIKDQKQEIISFLSALEHKESYQNIPKAEARPHYALSNAQFRLYFLQKMEPDSTAYNMPKVLKIEGTLDIQLLHSVFSTIVKRHEILRTNFKLVEEEPRQFVHPEKACTISNLDSNVSLESAFADFVQPFDLSKDALFRIGVYQKSQNEHYLCLDMHHIITDGVSESILVKEWMELYAGKELSKVELQYKDFSEWQQSKAQQSVMAQQKAFWEAEYQEEISVLQLPVDFERPKIQEFKGATIPFELKASVSKKLEALAKNSGTTLFNVLYALYAVFLKRLTGQNDLVIAVPTAGRFHQALSQTLGMFVNTLPIRMSLQSEASFLTFLESVKTKTATCFDQQQYPYESILEGLKIERDPSRNPLFDTLFSFQNYEQTTLELPGLVLSAVDSKQTLSKFDLSFTAMEHEGKLFCSFEYATALFKESTISSFIDYFQYLATEIVEAPQLAIRSFDFLPSAYKATLFSLSGHENSVQYSCKNLVQLLDTAQEKYADQVAVSDQERSWTYRELHEKANRIAWYLKSRSIQAENTVGVQLTPSLEMIATILGILKSGAAYVPVLKEIPDERLHFLVKDCKMHLLFVDSGVDSNVSLPALEVETVSLTNENFEDYNQAAPGTKIKGHQLATIVYTSGSTGTPKGVLLEHENIADYIQTFSAYFKLSAKDKILQQASLTFDTSQEEIFGALASGAELVVLKDGARDFEVMMDVVQRQKISVISATPLVISEINHCSESFSSLRLLISGGDVLKPQHIEHIKECAIYNTYGPSESTVCATFNKIESPEESMALGHPIANRSVYIVDQDLQLLPIGAVGEIAIAGAGLARGYLNAPIKTEASFVSSPHLPESRMYLTGDLGKWDAEGRLQFYGRKDHQVKIRGMRVELGEIESVLAQYPEISNCAVVTRGDKQENLTLVAYYSVWHKVAESALKAHMESVLPNFMVPSFFIEMEALPQTVSGKINRKKLPALKLDTKALVPPEGEEEIAMHQIWSEVLQLQKETIGVESDFFELGGHSLKAIRLVSRIKAHFKVQVELKTIFLQPKIRGLVALLKEEEQGVVQAIPSIAKNDTYLLSHSQKRLWYAAQLKEDQKQYHLHNALEIKGPLHRPALENALLSLIQRHEILRTVFVVINGEPRQKVVDNVQLNSYYQYKDLSEKEAFDQALTDHLNEAQSAPFNLSTGPLIRVRLLKTAPEEYIFTLTMHHIISDEWSTSIVVQEFLKLYEEAQKEHPVALTPLELHFKDFAAWQQNQLTGDKLLAHQQYWLSEFANGVPVVELATDFPRPKQKSTKGAIEYVILNAEMVNKINTLSHTHGATVYMTLMASLNAFLFRYTGQTDLVIGSPSADRPHASLENQIGFYVNMLPIRTSFDGENTFSELLGNVKTKVVNALRHQSYPFDVLVERLALPQDISRSVMFDVGFSWQPKQEQAALGVKNLAIESISSPSHVSRADMWFFGQQIEDEIVFTVEYNTDLFTSYTAKSALKHWKQLLSQAIATPEKSIAKLQYLSSQEQHFLLREVNETHSPYEMDQSIPAVFSSMATDYPNSNAVTDGSESMTYAVLEKRASQLALYLKEQHQVQEGDAVGILLDRSTPVVVALLAILKIGACYVPIDPAYPEERKKHIVQDAGIVLLITNSDYMMDLMGVYEGKLLAYDIEFSAIETFNSNEKLPIVLPLAPAYIVYTSGSTGRPKGVIVNHRSVVRLVRNTNYIDLNEKDKLIPTGSLSFDASTFEFWGMLLNGGSIVLVEQEDLLNAKVLKKEFVEKGVTVLWLTVALFNALAEEDPTMFKSLRFLLVGGDKLSPKHIQMVLSECPKVQLINGYGPTENTTFSVCHAIHEIDAHSIPIGKPISNSTAIVLDAKQNLVPIGVEGELFVGGDGLAIEYRNDADLTATKFVAHPFVQGERLYKTGDKVKRRQNGVLEFIGRMDQQVKINGYRIEPGEIEQVLTELPEVDQAVVTVVERDGDKSIQGYYTSSSKLSTTNVQTQLISRLPAYMVPERLMCLEFLPITSNGKVDRRALPEIKSEEQTTLIPPNTDTEKALHVIWKAVLGVLELSISTDFFKVGGDSIKAIRLITKVNATFGTHLEIKEVFQYPTIEDFAAFLDSDEGNQKQEALQEIKIKLEGEKSHYLSKQSILTKLPSQWVDFYPMSSIEKGMLFHADIAPEIGVYHDQLFSEFEDTEFHFSLLKRAFELLVHKHENLRASYDFALFDEPMKIVHSSAKRPFLYKEIQHLSSQQQQIFIKTFMEEDHGNPFDISVPGLWRIVVYRLEDARYGILWSFHHAILDGWSVAALQTELAQVYGNLKRNATYTPVLLKCNYKDYVQEQMLRIGKEEDKQFWNRELEGYKRSGLPLAKAYANKAHKTKVYEALVSTAKTAQLSMLAERIGVSMKTIFLAAFLKLIQVSNAESDVTVGLVTHGRPEIEDGDKMLGCFLNSIPFRLNSMDNSNAPSDSIETFLKKIEQRYRTQKAHDKLPLEEIALAAGIREAGQNPFFDILYNYIDFHIYTPEGMTQTEETLQREPRFIEESTGTNTHLDLTVSKWKSAFQLNFEYREGAYPDQQIEVLMQGLCTVLDRFIACPEAPLLTLQTEEEQNELLKLGMGSIRKEEFIPIHRQWELLKEKYGTNFALTAGTVSWTYAQLEEKSNALAHCLANHFGITKGQSVAIALPRSPEAVLSMLAVLKTGAAFVPIELDLPQEQIHYRITNSNAALVLSQQILEGVDLPHCLVTELDLEQYSTIPLPRSIKKDDLAYIMYTSGSTGKPKGVMVQHEALFDYCSTFRSFFKLDSNEVVVQQASLAFDTSIEEIFPTFLSGATLCIAKAGGKDIQALAACIHQHKVTVLSAAPIVLNALQAHKEQLKSLKTIISGGDVLHPTDLAAFDQVEIYNTYGPTETTICATYAKIEKGDADITIGKPIANKSIYLLDENQQLVPKGVSGEIVIGGTGVALGYLANQERTDQSFIQNPFGEGNLYKTGDRGKWLPDGNLLFLGRIDRQIKIRGQRLEPGEIESALLNCVQSNQVAVKGQVHGGNLHLIGYVQGSAELDFKKIEKALLSQLPEYMVPRHWQLMLQFPMLSTGKINYAFLPEYDFSSQEEIEVPQGDIGQKLQKNWAELLKVPEEQIGVNSDFFTLGGHSLLATVFLAKVKQQFQIEIPLAFLYANPDIKSLETFIKENKISAVQRNGSRTTSVVLKEKPEYKQNLFLLHDGSGDIHAYLPLVQAMEARNCYGIRSVTLQHLHPIVTDFATLAQHAIEAIVQRQPEGPYHLAGWSMGGVLAYEIARQLEALGKEVAQLTLLDADLPLNKPENKNSPIKLEQEIELIKELVAPMQFKSEGMHAVEEVWRWVELQLQKDGLPTPMLLAKIPKELQQLIPNREALPAYDLLCFCNTIRSLLYANSIYQISSLIKGKVVYVKASESPMEIDATTPLSKENSFFYSIQADHFSLLEQKNAKQLASVILDKKEIAPSV